jgi:hypothetical protein
MSEGFIKLHRGHDTEDLMRSDPIAFLLLTSIALRARRTAAPNKHNLKPGQAMLGDYARLGITRQRYRTALANLQKWGFITINPTNKGTIVSLINTAIYDINEASNGQIQPTEQPANNQQLTIDQPSTNHQLTTNKNVRKKECKNEIVSPAPSAVEEQGNAELDVTSDHQHLIHVWHDAFKAHFEEGYKFHGGRDAKAVMELLKFAGTPDAVMDVATKAWSNLSGFLLQHASTLHGLSGKWNEIQVAMKTGLKSASKVKRTALRPVDTDPNGGDLTEQFKKMAVGE